MRTSCHHTFHGALVSYLFRRPGLSTLLCVTLGTGVNDLAVCEGVVEPVLLQPLSFDLVERHAPALGEDRAEDMVLVRPLRPVQDTVLVRALDATRKCLLDIDMLHPVLRKVLDGEVDSGHGYGLPGEPTNALETQDFIAVVTERLILQTL